jgi:hypothetical protein
MGFIDVSKETEADVSLQEGDHERYAHYVTAADMMLSYVEGKPIMALCGKVWVPHKDPKKFPVCPTCKEIYGATFPSH